jgi:DUF4097 and DUF4098 domain-containing protein YvlB
MPVFETPDPITATLELHIGDIRITASDRSDTTVEVRPSDPGTDLDVKAAEQTRVEYADGRLLVKAPKQRNLGLFGKPGSIDVEIALPAGSRLDTTAGIAKVVGTGVLGDVRIKTGVGDLLLDRAGQLDLTTAAGDVTVTAAAGRASISTASGLLRVGEIHGDAVLKNSNGDTRLGLAGGTLKVNNANGEIVVERAAGDVTATTANGSIRIRSVTRGAVSLKTAFGGLEVGIPAGTAAYLDLSTGFGTVSNHLDGSGEPGVSDQRVEVRARTAYGDIMIRRPEGDAR